MSQNWTPAFFARYIAGKYSGLAERMDALADRAFRLEPEKERARRANAISELAMLIFGPFRLEEGSPMENARDELLLEGISQFMVEDMNAYDPDTQPFTKFFTMRVAHRVVDVYRFNMNLHRVTARGEGEPEFQKWDESLEASITPDGDFSLEDKISAGADAGSLYAEAEDRSSSAVRVLSAVLDLEQRLAGRARNPARINYFRLFFTDRVSDGIRNYGMAEAYAEHERELFQAMKPAFLDYTLIDPSRSVRDIAYNELKNYGQLVPGKGDKPPREPLPADVFRAYLDRIEQIRASDAVISQNRKHYQEFLTTVLGSEYRAWTR